MQGSIAIVTSLERDVCAVLQEHLDDAGMLLIGREKEGSETGDCLLVDISISSE